MNEFSVDCGVHGEVFEVGGECSVCTLVERNKLLEQVVKLNEIAVKNFSDCTDAQEQVEKLREDNKNMEKVLSRIGDYLGVESGNVDGLLARIEWMNERIQKH